MSRFRARFPQENPQVTVFVKECTSQRITLGRGQETGIYLADRRQRFAGIAMVEGLEPPNLGGIVIFRR